VGVLGQDFPGPSIRTYGIEPESSTPLVDEIRMLFRALHLDALESVTSTSWDEIVMIPSWETWQHDGVCMCGRRTFLWRMCSKCLKEAAAQLKAEEKAEVPPRPVIHEASDHHWDREGDLLGSPPVPHTAIKYFFAKTIKGPELEATDALVSRLSAMVCSEELINETALLCQRELGYVRRGRHSCVASFLSAKEVIRIGLAV